MHLLFPILLQWNSGQWVDEQNDLSDKESSKRYGLVVFMKWLNRLRQIVACKCGCVSRAAGGGRARA